MPKVLARTSHYGPHGGERIFADDVGQAWNASYVGEALVFTCVSDGRQPGRAIALSVEQLTGIPGDDELRAWLRSAPRIGRLT